MPRVSRGRDQGSFLFRPVRRESGSRTEGHDERAFPAGPAGARGRDRHDRRHASEGGSNGGAPLGKWARTGAIGRVEGGPNSRPHMVRAHPGRPPTFLPSPGRMSDPRGALALPRDRPPARAPLADRGRDADRFREARKAKKISAGSPARRGRRSPGPHDTELSRRRRRTGKLFVRPKGRRGTAPRQDRCGELILSAIRVAAPVTSGRVS